MRMSVTDVLAALLIAGLVLADVYYRASLSINAAILAFAGILLIIEGLARNPGLLDWSKHDKAERETLHGRLWSMTMTLRSAKEGSWNSREDLADLLAEAAVIKSGKALRPNLEMVLRARQTLKRLGGDGPGMKEVFGDHPFEPPRLFGFRRDKDGVEYLSALESAVALVQGVE